MNQSRCQPVPCPWTDLGHQSGQINALDLGRQLMLFPQSIDWFGCGVKQFSLWSCWVFPVRGAVVGSSLPKVWQAFCWIQQMDRWVVCVTSVGNGLEMLISQVWRCCCCCRSPFWKLALTAGTAPGGRRCGLWAHSSPRPALSVPVLEIRAQNPLWALCTAQLFPKRVPACSVPSRQGSSASRAQGPSRGCCSVLFQCILPPLSPDTLGCWVWWDSPGLCCPSGGGCCHPAPPHSLSKWITIPQHVGAIAETKNQKAHYDPVPAQPADRAGVAPHPGEDLQGFHFAELSDRSCSLVTFVVGSLAAHCEVGSTHQPVKNSWWAWSEGLSPYWQESRVLGSWGWHSWAFHPCWWSWFPHRHCLLPQMVQDNVSSNFLLSLEPTVPFDLGEFFLNLVLFQLWTWRGKSLQMVQ